MSHVQKRRPAARASLFASPFRPAIPNCHQRLPSEADILMDLPSPLPRRLNLGCGWDHRDGYLNVDCYERHEPDLIADISNLPMLPSGYFEEVLAKDVLEHFERTRTDTILAEWARLLSPDGHLVLELP